MPELVHTVQELKKHRTAIVSICGTVVSTPSSKHVAEGKPVFFDEDLEALDCPIEWVDHQLSQSAHLRSAVPSIGAMYEHVLGL